MAACQFVYEEKYITKYDIHPLKVTSFTNQNNHQADHHSLVGHTFAFVRPRTKFVDFHVKTIFICISFHQVFFLLLKVLQILWPSNVNVILKYDQVPNQMQFTLFITYNQKYNQAESDLSNSRLLAVRVFLGSQPWLWLR